MATFTERWHQTIWDNNCVAMPMKTCAPSTFKSKNGKIFVRKEQKIKSAYKEAEIELTANEFCDWALSSLNPFSQNFLPMKHTYDSNFPAVYISF